MWWLIRVAFAFLPDLDPVVASHVVAVVLEHPWLEEELLVTCRRESRCRAVGVHRRDRKSSDLMWERAVKVGWLRPNECHYHAHDAVDSWSTVGPFGASKAYTLHHLGQDCFSAALFDVSLINALASGLRMVDVAQGCRSTQCRRKKIRVAWRGRGKRKKLRE